MTRTTHPSSRKNKKSAPRTAWHSLRPLVKPRPDKTMSSVTGKGKVWSDENTRKNISTVYLFGLMYCSYSITGG